MSNEEKFELQTHRDHAVTSAENSITTVVAAMEELIANSAGAYINTRADKLPLGEVIINYNNAKGDKASFSVTDNAVGMDHKLLKEAFTQIGAHTSDASDRNIFGRGAKDCAAIGCLTIDTIKHDRYSTCEIDKWMAGKIRNDNNLNDKIRKKLGIKKNGTKATIQRKGDFTFPLFKNLHKQLIYQAGLQPYICEEAIKKGSKILLFDGNNKPIKLERKMPIADVVFDETLKIKGYDYKARFILKKSKKDIIDDKILIKSGIYRCHEESFLKPIWEDNPYLKKYCGEIICEGLHELNLEHRQDLAAKKTSKTNPRYTIEWGRRSGLTKDHPFVQQLLAACIPLLAEQIKKEEDEDNKETSQTSLKEQKVLNQLAKIGNDFINNDINPDNFFGKANFDQIRKYKWMVFPFDAKMLVNEKKKFRCYCTEDKLIDTVNPSLSISLNGLSNYIKIAKEIKLEKHADPEAYGIYTAEFTIESLSDEIDGFIKFMDGQTTVGVLKATIQKQLIRNFNHDLEFEHTNYTTLLESEKKPKKIKLYAKYPELITGKILVNPVINNQNIKFKGSPQCELKVVNKSNYAEAEFFINGRHLHESSTITVSVGSSTAVCNVNVVEKEDAGPELNIEVLPRDFGNERYYWNKPGSHLIITSKHPLTKNVLNCGKEDTSEYRVLIQEICADAFTVARAQKVTTQLAPQFEEWTHHSTPNEILLDVSAELRKIRNDILLKLSKIDRLT